jgi:putative transposase
MICWHRFGSMFAAEIRKRRIKSMRSSRWRWHLDEVFMKAKGERHCLWRAVVHEGEVLENFVMKMRGRKTVQKLCKKSLRRHRQPTSIVTDKLRFFGAALKEIGAANLQKTGLWMNNLAENSHLPFRRQACKAAFPTSAKFAGIRIRPRLGL